MKKTSIARYVGQIEGDPTMYVVANRTNAIFYLDGSDRKFHFMDRLKNQEGDLTEIQLDSDKPGTAVSSAGGGAIHHGLDRHFTHHEEVARTFARKIANQIGTARRQKRFGELVLVAEPHFLGLLRRELDDETRATIRHEVGREYAQGSDDEVRSRILQAIEAAG